MQLIRTLTAPAPLRGLALARERGTLLALDADNGLTLFDRDGGRAAQRPLSVPLGAACSADDGSCHAVGGREGQVLFLNADLTPRWERSVPQRATAVALEAFGQYVAAADGAGALHLFDRLGRPVWRVPTPRPLRHLAFVPERSVVVGSADFGLVSAFDGLGRSLWRDAPVAHVGALATSGDGGVIALACFSEGLCCYALDRPRPLGVSAPAPCRLAALSYGGDVVLTAGLDNKLFLRRPDGSVRGDWQPEGTPVALAVDALGNQAFVALAEGKVLCLDLRPDRARR